VRAFPLVSRLVFSALLVAARATPAAMQEPAARGQAAAVPAPESYLGFPVGADRRLADWGEVTGYLSAVAKASPRVRMDTLGRTTLGRPFVLLTIADPRTLAELDRYREIQARLADPRRVSSPAEAERLVAEGKVVVLITCAIHSTEVGASQVPLRIAYRLASSSEPLVREILDNAIVLLVPSLNPDGVDLVVDWYESTVGKPWEGASPPFLYHFYTGHDNNRDWYAFTQQETRLVVERVHNVWHPQIVHDIHQMGGRGARIFFPPYTDPVEPNVDPLLVQGLNQLGMHMAWELARQGKRGVVVNAIYDAWTPARAYSHYHGGVRILSETASANMASPVVVPFDSLEPGRGYDPRQASWNYPDPWPGGEWRLRDIVDYQEAGAFALLGHAARNRAEWLRSFYAVGRRAVGLDGPAGRWREWPEMWVIPAGQENGAGVAELLRILMTGGVEVQRTAVAAREVVAAEAGAGDPAAGAGEVFPAGSHVISMRQPYASFAQALLEPQRYPDLRLYPGGPPRRPYDVTAHTLPLLLGVRAVPVRGLEPARLVPVREPPPVPRVAPGLTAGTGRAPRIALYKSWAPSMDEGWTRWVLDQYRIRYDTLHDADVRAGRLAARYDVLVLPSQSPREIREGRRPGTVPPEYAGGLGEAGVAALAEFVRAGGTLVALEEASRFAIEAFGLPLRDVVAGLPPARFYIPGSILRLELDPAHPLSAGVPASTIAWFGEESFAFEPTGEGVRIVGRYGRERTLLSGWALGPEHVAGAGALAEARLGRGRVILFGFRPQYRGQSMATFPLFFNALRAGAAPAG